MKMRKGQKGLRKPKNFESDRAFACVYPPRTTGWGFCVVVDVETDAPAEEYTQLASWMRETLAWFESLAKQKRAGK